MWIITLLLTFSSFAGLLVLALCVAGSRADRSANRFSARLQDIAVLESMAGRTSTPVSGHGVAARRYAAPVLYRNSAMWDQRLLAYRRNGPHPVSNHMVRIR